MATREKIKLTSYNELLGINNEMISEIDINKLHQFKNHPFSVVDNEKMLELAKSIEKNGILQYWLDRWRMENMKLFQVTEEDGQVK